MFMILYRRYVKKPISFFILDKSSFQKSSPEFNILSLSGVFLEWFASHCSAQS